MSVRSAHGRGHRSGRSWSEWHAEVAALREQGLNGVAIARQLGCSSSFVYELLNDPEGKAAKERKDSYRRPCPQCGQLMTGGNGMADNAPRFCGACAPAAHRIWTRENIIVAIREYASTHGLPPTAYHWNPAIARSRGKEIEAEEFEAHSEWPATSTVQTIFGSWADAIEASGFPRPRPGYYRTEVAA